MTSTDYPFFFTWTAQKAAKPVELLGGDGAWFTTRESDGADTRWLDLGSFSYQSNLGHGHPRMIEAIRRQAGSLCEATPSSVFPAKIELAERLLALAPPSFRRGKVFFTLGGAEANENAMKIARLVTGRLKMVSRYRSYHGASMGALTLTGDWRRPPLEPGIPGVVHALDCYCDRCPFGKVVATCGRECARAIGEMMQLEGPHSVAGVILEPVPGANGVLVPPPEYWPMVRAACDREGALLIADEVLTGFGRTGRVFGIDHWGVEPDLITLAKGLTGGYAPMGAVLVSERVARHFDERVLAAGLTFYAHPLACAAGVEALKLYDEGGLYARAARLEAALLEPLRALQARVPAVRFVRGQGLLAALELEAPAAAWATFSGELARRRLSLHLDGKRGTAILAPPLVIEETDLAWGLAQLAEAAVASFAAPPGAAPRAEGTT